MQLHVVKPKAPLDQYINVFTYYAGHNPTHQIERLMPDGAVNLVIDLTEIPKYIFDNQLLIEKHKYTGAWLSGMHSDFLSISAGGQNSTMFVVQFKAGGCYPFAQIPLIELFNQVVDAELIFDGISDLREQLLTTASAELKVELVETWLEKHLQRCLLPETVIQYAVDQIIQNPSLDRLKMISEQCGYSQKQFIHLFKKFVGLSPKAYQRIIRFNQVLTEIERHEAINWVQLVYDCGYYDQAHFIKEFKLFSGFNPSEFLKERGEHINYIPIA